MKTSAIKQGLKIIYKNSNHQIPAGDATPVYKYNIHLSYKGTEVLFSQFKLLY